MITKVAKLPKQAKLWDHALSQTWSWVEGCVGIEGNWTSDE